MNMWLELIEDQEMYPPAQVKGKSYSILPHTVDFDPCISTLDSRVYSYLSHQAGLTKSAVVYQINAHKLGDAIGVSQNKVNDSLKILVARRHIRKRPDLGVGAYELLSEIYDKWRN